MKDNLLSLLACHFGFFVATAALAVSGDVDTGYDPNVTGSISPTVDGMAVQPDGKTIIGGDFEFVANAAHSYLARLNVNGSADSTFTANTNGQVRCVVVQPDGKVLIGGVFSTVNGVARNFIARLNANGSVESATTFDPGTGANGAVLAMVLQTDGKILLAGQFTQINGVARNYFARLNSDGSLESTATFNPGAGANGQVLTMAVLPDGKILIGGGFTQVNGITRNRIARLNPDGSVESTATFNPGSGASGTIYCLAVQADGKILTGGVFSNFNGALRNYIARLNPDGTLESTTTFNTFIFVSSITSMVPQADGKILIGGFFTLVNPPRNYLARLNADGSQDASFQTGTGANKNGSGVALQADGKILFGGEFTQMNGIVRNHFARLSNDMATQSLLAPDATRVRWLRGGAAPEISQVVFELSTNGGSTWSTLGLGTRIVGGWELTGQNLPSSGSLRARGRAAGGRLNGSSGLIEQVAAFPLPPFQQWKFTELGDANAPDLGDTDFDGLVHLAEYALNLSPTAPSLPPPAERHLYAEGERLRMFFTRDPARDDVTLEVQSADNPAGPWTTVAASTLGGVTTGPGYVGGDDATPGLKTVEVRDTVDISPTITSRYLRVKVTH